MNGQDQVKQPPPQNLEGGADTPIEGGDVGPIEDLSFHPKKHKEQAAKAIAIYLTSILAVGLLVHYAATLLLLAFCKDDAAKELQSLFNVWLPVVASLVSAAATYYFTRERSQ